LEIVFTREGDRVDVRLVAYPDNNRHHDVPGEEGCRSQVTRGWSVSSFGGHCVNFTARPIRQRRTGMALSIS
jgi:hypothetical protein